MVMPVTPAGGHQLLDEDAHPRAWRHRVILGKKELPVVARLEGNKFALGAGEDVAHRDAL